MLNLNRNLCRRGCPFGGYFSSNAATIPCAQNTGNLTLRPHSVVHSVLYDDQTGKASGVKVIDAVTKEEIDYFAKVIFLNASALNTNLILLNSVSHRFPEGLGNDNGILGRFVAFHNYNASITGEYEGLNQYKIDGRNPAGGGYVPRFRNVFKQETDFLRGYAFGLSGSRPVLPVESKLGKRLKEQLLSPELGPWRVRAHMMGETIPKEESYVKLDENQKDEWGIPLLRISIDYDENDEKMRKDFIEQFTEMFTDAGFKNIKPVFSNKAPGLDIHEMGGVRMGHDPRTSMLNKWNQLHHCKNVYVTDGACMTSTSTQNPSLTYMALTARAVDHAVSELKKQNI